MAKKDNKAQGGSSDALLRAPPLPKVVPNKDQLATITEFLSTAVVQSGQAAQRRQAFVRDALSHQANTGTSQRDQSDALTTASRRTVEAAISVSRKNVLALDPGLKRMVCKRCSALLLPGLDGRYRTRASGPHTRVVSVRCLACGHVRRWPAPPLRSPPQESTQSLESLAGEGRIELRRSTRLSAPNTLPASQKGETTSEAMEIDSSPSQPKHRKVSQRQRRRNGRMAYQAARALEGKPNDYRALEALFQYPEIQARAPKIVKQRQQQADEKERNVFETKLQPGLRKYPQFNPRWWRHNLPSKQQSPKKSSLLPVPASIPDLLDVYTNENLVGPTRKERLEMRKIERACRPKSKKDIEPERPTKHLALPPFFERVQGSDWAEHVPREVLEQVAEAQGHSDPLPPEHEEAAARSLRGGGHIET